MSELRTMNIPTLLREVAIDLCLQLGVIDVIHLSSENYDISCFLLSTGNDFEETKIPYGQSTLAPNDNDGDGNESSKYFMYHFRFNQLILFNFLRN